MNRRDSFRIERLANLLVQLLEFLQSSRHAEQPHLDGSKLASHQPVDRTTRNLSVEDRVPSPLLQLVKPPQIAVQLASQQLEIDLIVARQLLLIELAEFGEKFPEKVAFVLPRGFADVIELLVEAMVSQRRSADGRQSRRLVHIPRGHPRKLPVHLGGRLCHGVRFLPMHLDLLDKQICWPCANQSHYERQPSIPHGVAFSFACKSPQRGEV